MSVQEWFWWYFFPDFLFGLLALIFRKRLGVTFAEIEDIPGYAWLSAGVKDL